MQQQTTQQGTQELDFEAVLQGQIGPLREAARRLTRNHDEAEDLLQDTVVRAWTFWHRFEPGSNARAWLRRIMMNTFINGYRKKRRERELLQAAAEETRRSVSLRQRSQQAQADGYGDEVGAALDTLPAEFRAVVELVDLDDYSYREVAERLSCPIGTVMSRLHRARKQLQTQLGEYAVCQGVVPDMVASAA